MPFTVCAYIFKLQKMEIASQQAQENTELLHSTPPKAHGNIIRNLSKPLSQNRPRQVLHPGSPLVTQEIVKNEKVQLPVAATGTSSSSPPKVDGVTSQHARGKLSSPSNNPPVAKPSQRDPLNDNLDISTVSIFSDDGVDLLLEPSEDVIAEGNGLATLYSMLSVVRMYAPSPIRGPPEIQPRRRNVDPLKITAHPDDMAKSDGVAVGQTCKQSSLLLFECLRSSEVQGRYFIFDTISSSFSFRFFLRERQALSLFFFSFLPGR